MHAGCCEISGKRKNGQRNISGNYRPIYVLPAISKIMERILHEQL